MFKYFVLIVLFISIEYSSQSQTNKNDFPKNIFFASFTKVDLLSKSSILSDNYQFSFKYFHPLNKISKDFFVEYGINSIFASNFNWGIYYNCYYQFKIINNLYIYPVIGWEMQMKNPIQYLNFGSSIDYMINSELRLFKSYIIGLDFRYPIKLISVKDNASDIYSDHLPRIELKLGIGF